MKAKKRQQPLNLSGLYDVLGSASASGTVVKNGKVTPKPPRPVAAKPARKTPALESTPTPEPADTAPAIEAPAPEALDIPPAAETKPEPRPAAAKPDRQPQQAAPAADLDIGLARHAYLAAGLAALGWAGTLLAYVIGYNRHLGALANPQFQFLVFGALAGLPVFVLGLLAFVVREGARLAAEARRARSLSDDLILPTATAAAQSAGAAEHIRREIERASSAALTAAEQILSLRDALSIESQRLTQASADAERVVRTVSDTLGRERQDLGVLSGALEGQAREISEALVRQTRVVAEASDLAQTQIQEAEAALAARAADLAAASSEAGHVVERAGEVLSQQSARLHEAGAGLGDSVVSIEARLTEQRRALGILADSLSAEQEEMASRLDSHRVQLSEAVADARRGAQELGDASSEAAASLRSLIAAAAEQVRGLGDEVQQTQGAVETRGRSALESLSLGVSEAQAGLEAQARASLEAIAAAAETTRRAAAAQIEEARHAAEVQAEAAKARIEQLGEASFAASQRADQLFETRLSESRKLIEDTAQMIEEAGARSAARIEAGLDSTRGALGELLALMSDIDSRMSQLPADAREKAENLRLAVERGIGDLTAAARRTAEETQAIDAAFQERVRRNYAVLNEAVQLMARMTEAAAATPRPDPPPRAEPIAEAPSPVAPEPEPAPQVETPLGLAKPSLLQGLGRAAAAAPQTVFGRANGRSAKDDDLLLDSLAEETAEPAAAAAAPEETPLELTEEVLAPLPLKAKDIAAEPPPAPEPEPVAEAAPEPAPALRPRLKLTPTEDDEALKSIFEPAPEKEAAAGTNGAVKPEWERELDEWTWKDLLSSMDDGAEDDDDILANQLIAEIEALGVDSGALLPRARVEEIARSLQSGQETSARESIRRLAPAAIRRLSRRVLTDKALREQTDRYVQRYHSLLQQSVQKDEDGFMAAALLSSDPGRAYLLLDAAVGDLH